MKEKADNIEYLDLILQSIEAINRYVHNLSKEDFLDNELICDGVLMRLIVIGEYGWKLTDDIKANFSNIEWQQIRAARNFYVHTYGKINYLYVWEVVETDLKVLYPKLVKLKEYLIENK